MIEKFIEERILLDSKWHSLTVHEKLSLLSFQIHSRANCRVGVLLNFGTGELEKYFEQKRMKFIKKLDNRSRNPNKSGWEIMAFLNFELTKADKRDKMSNFGSIEKFYVQIFIYNFFKANDAFVS